MRFLHLLFIILFLLSSCFHSTMSFGGWTNNNDEEEDPDDDEEDDEHQSDYNGDDEWYIKRTALITFVDDTSQTRMEVLYDTHKDIELDQVQIKVLDRNCNDNDDDDDTLDFVSVVSKKFNGIQSSYQQHEDLQELEIQLHINVQKLYDYEDIAWFPSLSNTINDESLGTLEFCIRVDLVEDDETFFPTPISVTSIQTIVKQHISLIADFDINYIDVETQSVTDDYVEKSDEHIKFPVSICMCNKDYICNEDTEPILQNSPLLRVCIYPDSNDDDDDDDNAVVEIDSVHDYTLEQDNGHNEGHNVMYAIQNFESNPLTKIQIRKGVNGLEGINSAVIETRIISNFFNIPNGQEAINEILAYGTVYQNFVSGNRKRTKRRLQLRQNLRFKSNNTTTTTANTTNNTSTSKLSSLSVEKRALGSGTNVASSSAKFETRIQLEADDKSSNAHTNRMTITKTNLAAVLIGTSGFTIFLTAC